MDKDRLKGKANEVAGRAKRQAGEWTGDTRTQAQGGLQEVKGRVQNAWGKAKDASRDADRTHQAPHDSHAHSGHH